MIYLRCHYFNTICIYSALLRLCSLIKRHGFISSITISCSSILLRCTYAYIDIRGLNWFRFPYLIKIYHWIHQDYLMLSRTRVSTSLRSGERYITTRKGNRNQLGRWLCWITPLVHNHNTRWVITLSRGFSSDTRNRQRLNTNYY